MMNNSNKLDISIQNFDFVTDERFTELEQRLEEQQEEMYDSFSHFSSLFRNKSQEFSDYREFVNNTYLKIPRGIGRFRKWLFRIVFGVRLP